MDDDRLQMWVERISRNDFGLPFRHKARYNNRLRTTGGRYFPHDHSIEINPKYWAHGEAEMLGIIRHELCHYHLHLAGKGHRHRDQAFKTLLKQVRGSRFCTPLTSKRQSRPIKYVLTCRSCQAKYYRKKKMDPRRFRCGICRGTLTLQVINEGGTS